MQLVVATKLSQAKPGEPEESACFPFETEACLAVAFIVITNNTFGTRHYFCLPLFGCIFSHLSCVCVCVCVLLFLLCVYACEWSRFLMAPPGSFCQLFIMISLAPTLHSFGDLKSKCLYHLHNQSRSRSLLCSVAEAHWLPVRVGNTFACCQNDELSSEYLLFPPTWEQLQQFIN